MRGKVATLIFMLIQVLALGAAPKNTGPEKVRPNPTQAVPAAKAEAFEGLIDLRLSMETGSGELQLSLAGDMAKLEMQITVSPFPEPIRLTVLMDAKSPKTGFLISDLTKTYSAINLAEAMKPLAAGQEAGKYQVKILGEEKLLGFVCSHITLTRGQELIDAWITKDMPEVYRVLKKVQEANPQIGDASLFRALEETGHAGLPMRCIVIRDGQRVTTEVKKVQRKTLAASAFAIPKDYQRVESAAGGLQPTPEQIEQMKQTIQNALEGQ